MKALCWQGKHNVVVKTVRDASILNPHDALVKVTSAGICGSDLHLYDGHFPTMKRGDILGHETAGIIVDVGREVKKAKKGDRVVIAFDIACGKCLHCEREEFSGCENSNPNAVFADSLFAHGGSGIFGFSHLYGGYAGGQAEFIRVPFADVNTLIIPEELSDEKALFLSDIFPAGYMAAENCSIQKGDTVAVWGAGPVGQMAIRSAFMLGAGKVISIDQFEGRLEMSRRAGAYGVNFKDVGGILDEINYLTGGRGPDSCIDAVGLEAHGTSVAAVLDRGKAAILAFDRLDSLRQAIQACKQGGVVSIPGIYGGLLDKVPLGAAFGKGLTIKMGHTHTQRYMRPLLHKIQSGEIDPSFVITHRIGLEQGPEAYQMFHEKKDECIKVVIQTPATWPT